MKEKKKKKRGWDEVYTGEGKECWKLVAIDIVHEDCRL